MHLKADRSQLSLTHVISINS